MTSKGRFKTCPYGKMIEITGQNERLPSKGQTIGERNRIRKGVAGVGPVGQV